MNYNEYTAEFENVQAIRANELSLLCSIDGNEVWIPKSKIHNDSEVRAEGDEGTLVIPQWLAETKDLV